MKIYIASSWKNQHGVEMLTEKLRAEGFEVISWIENNYGENHNHVTKKFSFQEWMESPESNESFWFDVHGAIYCDIFIYYAPAGKDAHAELGAAWASRYGDPHNVGPGKKAIIGLFAKGEDLGLMSKMVDQWHERVPDLIKYCIEFRSITSLKSEEYAS